MKPKKPKIPLVEKLRAERLQGYAEGYRQAQADFATNLKAQTTKAEAEIILQDLKILEAMAKLGTATGQTIEAMARSLQRGRGM